MKLRGWKHHLVVFTIALLCATFDVFLVTGYTALYWAWVRADLGTALPFLPWARNFGMLAVCASAVALGILFSSDTFPISPKIRLSLSLLATATLGFFAEFRNEGKFYFKTAVHFFGPKTWVYIHLNQIGPSLGDFLYRVEYSHWNDFLMGPAIVSVLFSLVFVQIYGAFRNQGSISLTASSLNPTAELDQSLRFARILMNVGLFWFFIQAWAEKAGYLSNPHSSDEIDLPFEFAGMMLGFWMARVLTRPFDARAEKFRSTFWIDFLSSGVVGLLYTLIVSPLTEGIANAVAHSLYPAVPEALSLHEYTPLQRHMRPFELLLLAGAMWWGLNRFSRDEELTRFNNSNGEVETDSKWDVQITVAKASAIVIGYLILVAMLLSILEPEGLGWTLATAGAGLTVGTGTLLLARRFGQKDMTAILGDHETPRD